MGNLSTNPGAQADADTVLTACPSSNEVPQVSGRPNLIGTALGGYEVQALIGSGGMASVYRAFDPNLQRPVAVKVLSASAAAQSGYQDRFLQEARLIATLRHPNIVQVYDLGQQGDTTYMVQELLPGPTLEAWMADRAARGEPPRPTEILAIISHLASALDAAHATGIIHRDVKPANALWNAAGALVLTDFGVAKQVQSDANQTQIGTLLGTPSYLSPEQAQSRPLTAASDIYSLGVILYELIAGDVPFRGTTPMQVVLGHIQSAPPLLRTRRPNLPPAVEAVVQRALAKDPDARFARAGELAQALIAAWSPAPTITPAAQLDIHQQATRQWQPPAPRRPPAPSGASVSISLLGTRLTTLRPITARLAQHVALAQQRSGGLLPLLGGLLALLFLGGILLAWRGERSAAAVPSRTAVATAPAAPGSRATAAPTIPTPATLLSADTTDAIAGLRTLLTAGAADGRAGTVGKDLLAQLEHAQQALTARDTAAATQQLFAMQKTVLQGVRSGTIDRTFARQIFGGIESIATAHKLTLPLSVKLEN